MTHPIDPAAHGLNRRHCLAGLAALALPPLSAAAAHAAQAYPQRPVRLVVGFPAGTGPDIVARVLGQALSSRWGGVGVVVDNKPGAAGIIAAGEVARAPADGYTLMLAETGQLCIAPHTYKKLAYDPARDFQPISQAAIADLVLLVNPEKTPARDVQAFAAQARAGKGLFMATFGAGTPGHFGAYMLGDALELKTEAVHYRNTGDAIGGLISGDVQGVFATVGLALPHVQAGKLLALAATGDRRAPMLPQVPTFAEQGLKDLSFVSWFGVVVPAGIPAEVARSLETDVAAAMADPAVRNRIEELGFRATGTTAQAFRAQIAADSRQWGAAVRATGFTAD